MGGTTPLSSRSIPVPDPAPIPAADATALADVGRNYRRDLIGGDDLFVRDRFGDL
jgi:hypothetical protein